MGIKFGEIDSSQILHNEYKIAVLERVLELLIQRTGNTITAQEITNIRNEVVRILQQKYPNSGISIQE